MSSSKYFNYGAAAGANEVQVPSEIRCCVCKKAKNKDAFSRKRLIDLAEHITAEARRHKPFNAKLTPFVPCAGCSTQQVSELECHMCKKTKGLDGFSKTQRRNPDRAKCWVCMNEQLNMEPGGVSSDEDSESDDSEDSNPYYSGDEDEPSTVTGGASTMRYSSGGVRLPSMGGTIYSGRSTVAGSSAGGYSAMASAASVISSGPRPTIYANVNASSATGARKFAKIPSTKTQSKLASQQSLESDDDVSSEAEDDEEIPVL